MQIDLQARLIAACYEGDVNEAARTLREGARPEPGHSGEPSPLMYAAETGNVELVQLLLNAGADVNYRDDTGSTALECAAVDGNPAVANVLLSRGANNVPNKDGAKPSEYALHHGHPAVAQLIRDWDEGRNLG